MADKDLLLELTIQVLDLKKEKKDYNKEINERIKDLEAQIPKACRESTTVTLL